MILVRVRKDDRVHRFIGEQREIRHGFFAIKFWMQAAIEDDAFAGGIEYVAVRTDFDGPREISECDWPHAVRGTWRAAVVLAMPFVDKAGGGLGK